MKKGLLNERENIDGRVIGYLKILFGIFTNRISNRFLIWELNRKTMYRHGKNRKTDFYFRKGRWRKYILC
jgi:hypothetical protein